MNLDPKQIWEALKGGGFEVMHFEKPCAIHHIAGDFHEAGDAPFATLKLPGDGGEPGGELRLCARDRFTWEGDGVVAVRNPGGGGFPILLLRPAALADITGGKGFTWRRFFFESNQIFMNIDGPADWQKIREAYPYKSDADILSAREATYGGSRPQGERDRKPNYGFRSEHDGDRRLRDFFEAHAMPIPDRPSEESIRDGDGH